MKKSKGKGMISVDFTGVEASGGGRLLPEGPLMFEVDEIEEREGESSGQPYLAFTLTVADGEFKGTKAWDNFSLQPQSLWKLRGFLEAAGVETEDGPMDLDPEELIGKIVMADVVHEEYKGKTKHRIAGYSPVAEDDGEDEKPTPKKKKPEPEAEDEVEWKVKQRVTFKDGKKQLEGTITAIDGESVTVRVGRDEYEMDVSDLTLA